MQHRSIWGVHNISQYKKVVLYKCLQSGALGMTSCNCSGWRKTWGSGVWEGATCQGFFLLESQFCIKKHDPMITRYPSFNQVQHWCQVNHSSQWDMYQYDWGKTSTSFGQCPDYPSPTPARDLGTLFTFRKISKSICEGSPPPHTNLGNFFTLKSVKINPNLGDSQKKGCFILGSPPWVPCKRNCHNKITFLQGIKLEDKEGAARRERRLQVFLSFWSLVFLPFGKSPSIYQKSHYGGLLNSFWTIVYSVWSLVSATSTMGRKTQVPTASPE